MAISACLMITLLGAFGRGAEPRERAEFESVEENNMRGEAELLIVEAEREAALSKRVR